MNKKYLNISIFSSGLSILLTLCINIHIAATYSKASRKTQLWFGLTEAIQFFYQYYVAIFGIIALILAMPTLKASPNKTGLWIAIVISVISIALVFAKTWRLFV